MPVFSEKRNKTKNQLYNLYNLKECNVYVLTLATVFNTTRACRDAVLFKLCLGTQEHTSGSQQGMKRDGHKHFILMSTHVIYAHMPTRNHELVA